MIFIVTKLSELFEFSFHILQSVVQVGDLRFKVLSVLSGLELKLLMDLILLVLFLLESSILLLDQI
jgi:hypothetical protein